MSKGSTLALGGNCPEERRVLTPLLLHNQLRNNLGLKMFIIFIILVAVVYFVSHQSQLLCHISSLFRIEYYLTVTIIH